MATTQLTPTFTNTVTPVNLTTALVAATSTLQFANTGQQLLYFVVGATPSTASVLVGATVLGQAVTSFSEVLPVSASSILGPFPSACDQPGGTYQVQVTLSAITAISVCLIQLVPTN